MNSLDAFRSRAMEVRTYMRCSHCEKLQDDVQDRAYLWAKLTSCGACWTKLMAQVQSPVACLGGQS